MNKNMDEYKSKNMYECIDERVNFYVDEVLGEDMNECMLENMGE